ncbi:unnamed protein product [Paramecium primaurelia]|uniref:B9 domain-containing protein 2 n=1 Tax=Paramecium primaurelia TaxID=5886 RepID=A0A8S1PJ06_PARPR|nr:unnamed protein product [Paramecium primaurelia]
MSADSPQVFIVGKIAGATNFNNSSIYVKYFFRVGDHWKKISGQEEGETFQSSSQHSKFVPLEHPIDLNYVTKSVRGWPKLLVEVWEVDDHGRNSLGGYGLTSLPIEPGEYQFDIPCWRPEASFFDKLIGAYPELVHRDLLFSGESRFGFKVESTGNIHIELAIITKDFHLHGVQISNRNYLNQ